MAGQYKSWIAAQAVRWMSVELCASLRQSFAEVENAAERRDFESCSSVDCKSRRVFDLRRHNDPLKASGLRIMRDRFQEPRCNATTFVND